MNDGGIEVRQHHTSLVELPEEVLRAIFLYLSDDDVFSNVRMVNRRLKGIADNYLTGKAIFPTRPLVLN